MRPRTLLAGIALAALGSAAAAVGPFLLDRPSIPAGRALAQQPAPPPPAAPPPASSTSDVHWSVHRASHGGGIRQAPGSGLHYISVPHAVLLGSVASRSSQRDEAACAAACAADRAAIAFNYCPANAASGCQMDTALFVEPAGSCFCLAQTAIQTPSLLPLLGSGSRIATVAGAPLAPELAALPPTVGGYRDLPGYSLFGVGNTVCGPKQAGLRCRRHLVLSAYSTSAAQHLPHCHHSVPCSWAAQSPFRTASAPCLVSCRS